MDVIPMYELLIMASEGDHKPFVISVGVILGIIWWIIDNTRNK